MSDPKEKYFVADFNEGNIYEHETLEQALSEITSWLNGTEETEEQINKGDLIIIKGVEVLIKVEKKATQG